MKNFIVMLLIMRVIKKNNMAISVVFAELFDSCCVQQMWHVYVNAQKYLSVKIKMNTKRIMKQHNACDFNKHLKSLRVVLLLLLLLII